MAETKPKVNRRVAIKKPAPAKYDKTDLLKSSGFTKLERDILKVTLKSDIEYTLNEAKLAIKKFKEAI